MHWILNVFKPIAIKRDLTPDEQERYKRICKEAVEKVALLWFDVVITHSNEALERGVYDEIDIALYLVQGIRRTLRCKLRRKESSEDFNFEAHELIKITLLDEEYPISWWIDTDAWECFFDSLAHSKELAPQLTTALKTLGYVEQRLKYALIKVDKPSL